MRSLVQRQGGTIPILGQLQREREKRGQFNQHLRGGEGRRGWSVLHRVSSQIQYDYGLSKKEWLRLHTLMKCGLPGPLCEVATVWRVPVVQVVSGEGCG